jgi:hypothetical protein
VTLTARGASGSAETTLSGPAGTVLFVALRGSAWAWGTEYRFEALAGDEGRREAAGLRLVADVASARRQ